MRASNVLLCLLVCAASSHAATRTETKTAATQDSVHIRRAMPLELYFGEAGPASQVPLFFNQVGGSFGYEFADHVTGMFSCDFALVLSLGNNSDEYIFNGTALVMVVGIRYTTSIGLFGECAAGFAHAFTDHITQKMGGGDSMITDSNRPGFSRWLPAVEFGLGYVGTWYFFGLTQTVGTSRIVAPADNAFQFTTTAFKLGFHFDLNKSPDTNVDGPAD